MKKKFVVCILVISLVCISIISSASAGCGKFGGVVSDEYWAQAWADKAATGFTVWVEARLHDNYGTKVQVADTSANDYAYVETGKNWGICVDYCYATYDYELN